MMVTPMLERLPEIAVALFPGYPDRPQGSHLIRMLEVESPLGPFEILGPKHTSFAAEWPIRVDVPASIRGFRHALGLSQVRFAALVGEKRVNIERWEGGKSRPFRGHALSLLSLFRPHVDGRVAAGQLLNLAAAAVCPTMTRPGAIYTGHEIAAPLADKRHDHRDLLPALLSAFRTTEVLVPLEPDEEEELGSRYLPLVGANLRIAGIEPWDADVRAVARRLAGEDRRLWLAIGQRLGGW